MTVPGVNLICAATFIAAVGDPTASSTSRKLVAYLGLDPKVRQSGEAPARTGGSASVARRPRAGRWSRPPGASVRQPGPLHAFYHRIRARRGHGKAIVAAARKLACLFWCMLTRREDYAHQQPSLTNKKLRRLEITAGAPKTPRPRRHLERQRRDPPRRARARPPGRALLQRMVRDQQAEPPARRAGASATPGRA